MPASQCVSSRVRVRTLSGREAHHAPHARVQERIFERVVPVEKAAPAEELLHHRIHLRASIKLRERATPEYPKVTGIEARLSEWIPRIWSSIAAKEAKASATEHDELMTRMPEAAGHDG